MSFQTMHWALHEVRGLPKAAKWTLFALAEYSDDRDEAWPSQEALADVVEVSVSTVRRALRTLERLGLIETTSRYVMDSEGDTHRASNVYRLHVGAQPVEPSTAPGALPEEGEEEPGKGDTPIPVRMTGMEDSGTKVPVDNLSDEQLFVASTDTGQNDRYGGATRPYRSNRGGIPVTTMTGISTPNPHLEPPDLTLRRISHQRTRLRVGSGREGALVDASGATPVGGGRRGPTPGAARGGSGVASDAPPEVSSPPPQGGASPRTTPERRSQAPGAAEQPSDGREGSGRERPSESLSAPQGVRAVIAACLPEHLRGLDAQGARRVAGLLDERLAAGWRPSEIRALMDQPLPERTGRLSSLVAYRLSSNVDPGLAPARVDGRRAEARRQEAARRRSEELAGTGRDRDPVREAAEAAAWERARREAPGASRLGLAQRVNEILAEDSGGRGGGGAVHPGRGQRARGRRVS